MDQNTEVKSIATYRKSGSEWKKKSFKKGSNPRRHQAIYLPNTRFTRAIYQDRYARKDNNSGSARSYDDETIRNNFIY